jgi:hypothetical protein
MLDHSLNLYNFSQLAQYQFKDLIGTKFFDVETYVVPVKHAIGSDPSNNTCGVKFTSSHPVEQWECRATKEGEISNVGVGLLIAQGGAVELDAKTNFDVTSMDLTYGDGVYKITVYVRYNSIWYGGV